MKDGDDSQQQDPANNDEVLDDPVEQIFGTGG